MTTKSRISLSFRSGLYHSYRWTRFRQRETILHRCYNNCIAITAQASASARA